jgi:hypothetical protein
MRLVYVFIFPLLLVPIGQPAGESSVSESTEKPATNVAIAKITIDKPSVQSTTKKKKIVHTKERKEDTDKTVANSEKSTHTETQAKQPTKIKSPKPTKQTNTKQTDTKKQSDSQQKPTSNRVLAADDKNILAVEPEVVRLVDIERSKQGLKSLSLDSKLSTEKK